MAKAPAREKVLKKKACAFCKEAKKDGTAVIDYKDTALLRKFVSDRGKIRARRLPVTRRICNRRVLAWATRSVGHGIGSRRTP